MARRDIGSGCSYGSEHMGPRHCGQRESRGTALRQVRQVIERLLRDGTVVAGSDGTVHRLFPVAIDAAEGEALRQWVVREGATRTIEIGLGYGISALFVCEALLRNSDAAARHVVVDPYQTTRFGNCGLQVLEEAGVASLVEHHAEESQITSRDSSARAVASTSPSSTATTASTGSSSTWSTSAACSTRAPSWSWTTTSCRQWPVRRRSA